MAAWFKDLARNAEDLLNKVDKTAAGALNQGNEYTTSPDNEAAINAHQSYSNESIQSNEPNGIRNAFVSGPVYQATSKLGMTRTGSSPNLGGLGSSSDGNSKSKAGLTDDQLFEFLNAPDASTSTTLSGTKSKNVLSSAILDGMADGQTTPSSVKSYPVSADNGHSRNSSISSVTSARSFRSDGQHVVRITPTDTVESKDTAIVVEPGNDVVEHTAEEAKSDAVNGKVASIELENTLLKQEVANLNGEIMQAVKKRKDADDEANFYKNKLDYVAQQMSQCDEVIRELRSKESDMEECLRSKEAQLAVLRVRLQEADTELEMKREKVTEMSDERERILKDHNDSSGVHGQALDTLRSKLEQMESCLTAERSRAAQLETACHQTESALETERQTMAVALADAQKQSDSEKKRVSDMSAQLRTAKNDVTTARSELTEYKQKAQRILQSKDKLIAGLKEGSHGGGEEVTGAASAALLAELEQVKQERDMLREELQQLTNSNEALRSDLAEVESQAESEVQSAREQVSQVQDQLDGEVARRQETERSVEKKQRELQHAQDELYRQKLALQGRLQDREMEIEKLRQQLTTKSLSSSTEAELEGRIHALTESLIQKQTTVESLSTEKSSLLLQLERLEKQYRELQACSTRGSQGAAVVGSHSRGEGEEDTSRARIPHFLHDSPWDARVTRGVKRAYRTIDTFSIRLGVFMRRYPVVRAMIIVYMIMLHFWVMFILLTYSPEIHGHDFAPAPSSP